MARQRTRSKVHEAVLSLARDIPVGKITMEGIALRASISKQTLYRTWPSTGAVFFDAILARSTDDVGTVIVPTTDNLTADLEELATATIAELTEPNHEPLLRAVAGEMQSDETLAAQYRELLLRPQLDSISQRFQLAGVYDPEGAAEAFVGPIFHCWFLRTRPIDAAWVKAHVARVVRGSVSAFRDGGTETLA
ncbi:MAG: TetR-like C-terminal domain-containing protein [Ancrocorticia sp.]